jgi:hypothetical protein
MLVTKTALPVVPQRRQTGSSSGAVGGIVGGTEPGIVGMFPGACRITDMVLMATWLGVDMVIPGIRTSICDSC